MDPIRIGRYDAARLVGVAEKTIRNYLVELRKPEHLQRIPRALAGFPAPCTPQGVRPQLWATADIVAWADSQRKFSPNTGRCVEPTAPPANLIGERRPVGRPRKGGRP